MIATHSNARRVAPFSSLLTKRPCFIAQGKVEGRVYSAGEIYRRSRLVCVTTSTAEIVGMDGPAVVPLADLPAEMKAEAQHWLAAEGLKPQSGGADA